MILERRSNNSEGLSTECYRDRGSNAHLRVLVGCFGHTARMSIRQRWPVSRMAKVFILSVL